MNKYTLKIDGMMCEHCEAHMNDTIRNNFTVKSVSSSHKKGTCEIVADELDEAKLKDAVADTGYTLISLDKEPYAKKGIFAKLKK